MTARVLIVEDDPAQRRILEEMMQAVRLRGRPASIAAPRASTCSPARPGGQIELVILDLVMPGMDGLEFLERMTAVRGHVPVIVQTAQGSIETVIKAMRAGADDFVVKPISPERLRVSMQNLLKVNALTEEVKRLNKKVGGALTFDDLIASSPGDGQRHPARPPRRSVQHPDPDRRPVGCRQGDDRPRHPGRERAARPSLRRGQLRRHPGKPGREHSLRPREGLLHRRHVQASRQVPGSRQRHAVPRRGGRIAARHAGEAAARHPGRRDRSGRLAQAGQGQHPADLRHQPQHDRDGEGRASSARISTTASMSFRSWCRRSSERKDDIPALVNHFITRFAAEEGRKVHGIEADGA